MGSIREYKSASLKAPLFVSMEVVMECIIPFIIARLVNQIKAGCGLDVIARYGALLIVMAALSLTFVLTVLPQPADLQKIFVRICSIISKLILLKTSIVFLHHPW